MPVQSTTSEQDEVAPSSRESPEGASSTPVAKGGDGAASQGVLVAAVPSSPTANRNIEPALGPWWLRRRDQVTLACLTAACLALIGVYLARLSGWGRQPIEWRRLPQHTVDYRVDLNTANWVELAQLPRIGRTMAERIIEERKRNGPFRSVDDLQRVPGIGPKTIEHIRQYLEAETAPGEERDRESVSGTR